MKDDPLDVVLSDILTNIRENRNSSIDFAFAIKDHIKGLSEQLKYGFLINVEIVDGAKDHDTGISIFPVELYYEPTGATRDGFLSTLSDIGEEWSYKTYEDSVKRLKEILMPMLGIIDTNNIPKEILSELEKVLWYNYQSSKLGRTFLFFDNGTSDIMQIDGSSIDFNMIKQGDLLIRVAAEGFRGKSIYIPSYSLNKINVNELINKISELIKQSNKDFEDEFLS